MSLDGVRARLSEAAIMLDFDGTLAPIVPEPEDAYPWPGVADVLADLVGRAALVAIVTGRPESFVRGVLDVPKLEVVGLYGLEGAAPLGPEVSEALRSLAATEDGARIEHKGVSVSVHVRGAPDPEAATARLRGPAREIATRFGLAMFEGKRVIELAPPGARKGGVVRQLLVRVEPDAALYAGDDLEDGEAFHALDELAGPTCRVAVTGVESPEELLRAADLLVEGPPGLLEILRTL
jgi:trehalose 6-phosphate phosphatase